MPKVRKEQWYTFPLDFSPFFSCILVHFHFGIYNWSARLTKARRKAARSPCCCPICSLIRVSVTFVGALGVSYDSNRLATDRSRSRTTPGGDPRPLRPLPPSAWQPL